MTRTINSSDVIDYASHIPEEEVHLDKKETIVYANGNLKSGTGVSKCELMPEVCSHIAESNLIDICYICKCNFLQDYRNSGWGGGASPALISSRPL